MTIQEYATTREITYEAARQAVNKAMPQIKDHISKQGRTRILDEQAVKILDDNRKGFRVSVVKKRVSENQETIDQLKNEIILLQKQLIDTQEELRNAAENVARLEAIAETSKTQASKIDQLQAELNTFHKSFFGFYRKDKQ